ncbi:alpha-L-fucosidase [uncultured Draconibacterium sp.]|uniref:alpha-L-fucosidase n=1 Tax=uncultured Draconibacterium sp. TaxID=1573823 RepID=UPI0029C85995|nr:alpha-L-fucosidase [uncultured Draconibacterium sp.]
MKKRLIILASLILIGVVPSFRANAQYQIPQKLKWWYNDRFGMFIHFGSYSYLAHGEWAFSIENWVKADYQQQVSPHFNPSKFDAREIVQLAKDAGMKYIVITAKHHEGFSMWDTKVKSFKDVTGKKMYSLQRFTPFGKRDVLMELKKACDVAGIKFCLYYSILDWGHSSQEINHVDGSTYSTMKSDSVRSAYIRDMKAQLKELIDRYHPASLWFDGDWTYNAGQPTPEKWWTKTDGVDLYNYLTGLDSNLVVNERVCRSFGLGDYECPEQEVPDAPRGRQWETCQTMNRTWGYNKNDNDYKSTKNLVRELVKVVSRDGNYLLNIGPKGDGTVPEQTADTLKAIGKWMDSYGESIYGTTRSPFAAEPEWVFYTKKEGKLFAHVFSWPQDGILSIPAIKNSIAKIYLMNDPGKTLDYSLEDGSIRISLPMNAPNDYDSVVVLEVAGLPEATKF